MSFDDYFFVRPGFARGAARVIDLGAALQKGSYLISETPDAADARAILSDFAVVDRDLGAAAAKLAHEQKEEKARAR